MAKFKVLETSFINDQIHEKDAVIDFDGFPGPNLEPMDASAKKLAAHTPVDSMSAERMSAAANGATLPDMAPN